MPRLGLAALDDGVGIEGQLVEVGPVGAAGGPDPAVAVDERVGGQVAGLQQIASVHPLHRVGVRPAGKGVVAPSASQRVVTVPAVEQASDHGRIDDLVVLVACGDPDPGDFAGAVGGGVAALGAARAGVNT